MNPRLQSLGIPYEVPNTLHTLISTQAGTIPYLKGSDMRARSYTREIYSPGYSDLQHCTLESQVTNFCIWLEIEAGADPQLIRQKKEAAYKKEEEIHSLAEKFLDFQSHRRDIVKSTGIFPDFSTTVACSLHISFSSQAKYLRYFQLVLNLQERNQT